MYQNILLALFGSAVGLCTIFAVRPLLSQLDLPFFAGQQHSAMQFDSVEDLHRTMLEHDERDQKQNQNVSLRSIITPHPNEDILFDLRPKLDVRFQEKATETNSCGMRSPERHIAKSSDTIRVLFLGDSFTFGWGVEQEEAFPAVTERVLNRYLKDADQEVEVINMGVPGYSTFQEVALFLERGIDFEPDIVVVFFVDNDFGLPFFISSLGSSGKMITSSEFAEISVDSEKKEQYQKGHDSIVRKLDPNRALRKLVRKGRRAGFKVFLAFNPHPNWQQSYKRLWYARKSPEIEVIKPRERFLHAMENYDLQASDLSLKHDPHPSAIKHALLGSLIAESLFPEVDALQSQLQESQLQESQLQG